MTRRIPKANNGEWGMWFFLTQVAQIKKMKWIFYTEPPGFRKPGGGYDCVFKKIWEL